MLILRSRMIVKIRPEHVPHILRVFDVESGYRSMLIKTEYSGYSQQVLLANLNLFQENNVFEIVPSIDDLCKDCSKKENCKETDASLFDLFNAELQKLKPNKKLEYFRKALDAVRKEDAFLADSIPFTYLIGKRYTIEELSHIKDNPHKVLEYYFQHH